MAVARSRQVELPRSVEGWRRSGGPLIGNFG